MEILSHTDSRGMYSWWWNSHISPKNSKWLQENLTDMDVKVKSMIRLIEEDADSFARRAEMYYKKRPELMKMVEEFYRSYRALAERYNHATGVIRQAHHTMSEAFPDQVPSMLSDDSRTPNGEFGDEFDSCTERKTVKQVNERVRRGLDYDEKEHGTHENGNIHDAKISYSEEILALKEVIAKLESEKETELVQYDKLSEMETEISKTRQDLRMLTDHANKSENEVVVLKEKLIALDSENESLRSELTEKTKEMGKLWDCMQEERFRFAEELRAMASELQNRAHLLEVGGTQNQSLQDEVIKVREENKKLDDQRNSCLKELNDLNKKHVSLGLSVRDLRYENSCLKETCLKESGEKAVLLGVKLELDEAVENLRSEYNEVKTENDFLRESSERNRVDLEKSKIEEENFHFVLQKKVDEINELEILGASIFRQLQNLGVSQLVYEHKFRELSDVVDDYMGQNAVLKSQMSAYGPEIMLLKECVSSLENQTDAHVKFPNPENEELQDAKVAEDQSENILNEVCNESMIPSDDASELHNLTARIRAIVKATTEEKDVMIRENASLHSKLDETIKELKFLQSNQNEWRRRSQRPASEITSEGEDTLLTKDIVLDQTSDTSSYGLSKRQHQHWETSNPKKTTSEGLENFEISNESFGEGDNREKVLERLDSDVQKLENIQITVQDLKRKLEVTEKGKRGKEVIECEAFKGQLEETDAAVVKLFELNESLVKSIDEMSFSDKENEGRERRRRVSKHAQRMSEKIGRLQLEVQKLQFVLMKVDEVKDKDKDKKSVSKRTVLRDYLYGVGLRKKKKTAMFCACMHPSTVEV